MANDIIVLITFRPKVFPREGNSKNFVSITIFKQPVFHILNGKCYLPRPLGVMERGIGK